MRNEITAAVLFLVKLIGKNEKFSSDQLDCFRCRLTELLTERFKNHWFPEKPFKGQGYRCIRVNGHSRRDQSLEKAAIAAGFKYEDLTLPVELTLWVDPHEVCCRFGESKGSYCTLASFENETIFHEKKHNAEKENKSVEGSTKTQKSPSIMTMDQQHKPKPLSSSNQNHQQSNNNIGAGRRRNLNSPRPHPPRNRQWPNGSFNMPFPPHPSMNPSWYNVMPPNFFNGPSPPSYTSYRGPKWGVHPSYLTGNTRFPHFSQKAALKV